MADDAGDRTFEWDENKRLSNIAKHGIDFEDAKQVFSDQAAFTFASARSADEHRYVTVGLVKGTLMAVIFTRRAAVIRIISARIARDSERQMYG
jgi:uncharacterized DUF497 family protein